MTLVRHETPEEKELARKLAELSALEESLAQRELDLATQQSKIHSFEARYLDVVGRRFADLDEVKARIAEARMSAVPDNSAARADATAARETARGSARAAGETQGEIPRSRFQPSDDLKKLFREVAKRIHPDLADDEPDRIRRTRLMAEANRAFEQGDETKLRAILDEWESSPESVRGEGAGAELVRVIRKIAQARTRLRSIEAELDNSKETDMNKLMQRADEAEAEGRDLLAEMAEALDHQISDAKNELTDVAEE